MIEVRFNSYNEFHKAYHWCVATFGLNTTSIRWKTNWGTCDNYDALLFKDKNDALLCMVMWA